MSIDFLTKLYIKIYKSKNIFPCVGENGKKTNAKKYKCVYGIVCKYGQKMKTHAVIAADLRAAF